MVSPQYSGPVSAGTDASVTTTAEAGPDTPCRGAVIQADPDNGADVFLGDSASQPLQLSAGQSLSIRTSNLNQVFWKSDSGTQVINFMLEL